MRKSKLALIGAVLAVVGIAIAVAQQQPDVAGQDEFVPTETIGVGQGVAFPVDI